jgi:hypothetical protein
MVPTLALLGAPGQLPERGSGEQITSLDSHLVNCHRGESRCPATVDDLEQCLTDLHYNLYGVFLTAPMCDDICRTFDPSALDAASCRRFRASCPGTMFSCPPAFPQLAEGVPDDCFDADGGTR